MAIAYRAGSFAKATTTSLAVAAPPGVVSGDALLAHVLLNHQGNYRILTPPSGFALIDHLWNSGNFVGSVYAKIAGASEPASYTWGVDASIFLQVVLTAYSGVDGTMPISTHAIREAPNNALPGLTVPVANSWLVACVMDESGLTPTDPDQGYTLASGTPNSFDAMFVGYKTATAIGDYGGEVFSGDTSSGAVTSLVTLNPAGALVVSDVALGTSAPLAQWPPEITYVNGNMPVFTAGSTNLSLGQLGYLQEGDLVLVALLLQDAGASIPVVTPPTGWLHLDSQHVTSASANFSLHTYAYPVSDAAKASLGGAYPQVFTTDVGPPFAAGALIELRGIHQATPVVAHAMRNAAADNTLPSLATPTGTGAGAMAVALVVDWQGQTNTDPDQGYTRAAGTPSGFSAWFIGYKPNLPLGTYGGETFSGDTSGGAITSLILLQPQPFPVSESASGSESIGVTQSGGTTPISASDLAAAAEALAISATLGVGEGAVGGELATIGALASVLEGASGTESLTLVAGVPVQETGLGTQTPVILVVLGSSDPAAGSDAINLPATVFATAYGQAAARASRWRLLRYWQ